jgi:hypothetical protein
MSEESSQENNTFPPARNPLEIIKELERIPPAQSSIRPFSPDQELLLDSLLDELSQAYTEKTSKK